MAFKDNLCRLRKERGFASRRDFAINVLGISYTTYNGYEVRGSIPSEEMIIKIARVLNVSIDELFGYNGKTQERDVDIAVRELNSMGITAKLNEEYKEVGIFIRSNTRFASIPYEDIVDMVKTAKKNYLIDSMESHIIYSIVIRLIITYVEKGKTKKKKHPILSLPDIKDNNSSQNLRKSRPYTKGEKLQFLTSDN